MRFKNYEHLHWKTLTGQDDARKPIATVLHASWMENMTINKYAQFDTKIL